MGGRLRRHPLLTSNDWWAVWLGLTTLATIICATLGGFQSPSIIPQKWESDPLEQDVETGIGFAALVLLTFLLLSTGMACILPEEWRKKASEKRLNAETAGQICAGVFVVLLVGTVAIVLGKCKATRDYGMTEVLFGIILGLAVKTVLEIQILQFQAVRWLREAVAMVANGEFFIKAGLVMLGLEIRVVGELGLPGILASWPVTVLVIFLMYQIGIRLLRMKNKKAVLVLAAGTAVCGASAATAVQAGIGASKDDLAASITIITLFTLVQMVSLPYLIRHLELPSRVAGGWIGGSIDATGAVVGAAEIVDDEEVIKTAATFKVVQNAFIGFLVLGLTLLWKDDLERNPSSPQYIHNTVYDTDKSVSTVASATVRDTPKQVPKPPEPLAPERPSLTPVAVPSTKKEGRPQSSGGVSRSQSTEEDWLQLKMPFVAVNPCAAGRVGAQEGADSQVDSVEKSSLSSENWLQLKMPSMIRLEHLPPADQRIGGRQESLQDSEVGIQDARVSCSTSEVVVGDIIVTETGKERGCCHRCGSRLLDKIIFLRDRFPKFILGFFIVSAIISVLKIFLDESEFSMIQGSLKNASQWWFALGFSGLGLEMDVGHLVKGILRSPLVPLYVIGQFIDLVLTLGAAQLAYNNDAIF